MNRHANFIDGRWVKRTRGRFFVDRNPSDKRDCLGEFPLSDVAACRLAVRAAQNALPAWARMPAPVRAEYLVKALRILEAQKADLASLIVREVGKTLPEAQGDVQEAIDTAYFFAGEGRRLFGQTTPSELKDKLCLTLREPVGVTVLITPWNFPVAIPSWKIFPALICGNTVVLKPSEHSPLTAERLVRVFEEAGLPRGVINLVHGDGSAGRALVRTDGVRLVSFTGSSRAGADITRASAPTHIKHSLEMGGKNAIVVTKDADLDLAVEGALWGAFSTAGQRCTASSRIILDKCIAARFKKKFIPKVRALRVGNPQDPAVHIGPLVSADQMKRVLSYIQRGLKERAVLLTGGKRVLSKGCSHGFFVEPTVFDRVKPAMRIAQEEIFGPVTCLIEAGDTPEALQIVNATGYGLSCGFYSRDVNACLDAVRRIQTGIVYVNGPSIGAESHLAFGGVKASGNGWREAGVQALDIFSEWKTVYIDHSGRLQRAQIDTHDPDA